MSAPDKVKSSESMKRTKAENTTTAANQIIDAEVAVRKSKTARLRAARLAREAALTKVPAKKVRRTPRQLLSRSK
jgi:hypothetical protein